MTSRRDVLKVTLGTVASAAIPAPVAHALQPAAGPARRQKLTAPAYTPLPLGEILPSGWLRRQLRIQADGMGGHLDEFWPDVGSNSGWLGGTGESWERGPYFVDGLLPLAYLLDDDVLKAKAMRFVEWTLTHQAPNGMIGPASNNDWWPRMVMVKVLAQYYEASHDARVLAVLTRYFRYQLAELPKRPLASWGKFRWQDEVTVVQWLYDRTHDAQLLQLCALLQTQGFDWTGSFANFTLTQPVTRTVLASTPEGEQRETLAMRAHGVNNGQGLKTAAVQFRTSGDSNEKANYDRQLGSLDTYHGMPNGMFSCDEHLGGLDPSHGTELCTVVETMFSMELALAAFGDPLIGDRIEKIAFNALPGTFTDDMWAHQYDQQPNQIQCSLNSKPWTTNSVESNLYGLEPHFGCCTANFHQGWPKFTASLWMRSPEGGLVAALYSPCEVKTRVHETEVRLSEQTEYPFRGSVRITVTPAKALHFPLSLRIPAWAQGATIQVNGSPAQAACTPGTFARVDRLWSPGDIVDISLPMQPKVSRWYQRSVALERGPLVFSLSPGENWVKLRDRDLTADWQVFPTKPWNYALSVDKSSALHLAVTEHPVPARPFSQDAGVAALEIKVPGRRLTSWRSEDGVANPLPPSPVPSENDEEVLTLVPYAAAKLRVTAFPQLGPKAAKAT